MPRTRPYRPLEKPFFPEPDCLGPPFTVRSPRHVPGSAEISANGTGWHESDISRWIADPVGWRPKGGADASS